MIVVWIGEAILVHKPPGAVALWSCTTPKFAASLSLRWKRRIFGHQTYVLCPGYVHLVFDLYGN